MTIRDIRTWLVGATLILATGAAATAQEGRKAAGGKGPIGGSPWSAKSFVHPPLKCMEPYTRFDEYPISAWSFHGDSKDPSHPLSPYGEAYVRNAKAIGFNVLIDDDRILPYAEKVGGVKVQLAKLWLNAKRLDQEVFHNPQVGDNPLIQGIVMGDNGRGFGPLQIQTATWLKENYPYVAPIMSMYPARMRSDTAMRIWHMQNYPFMSGRSNNPPTHYLRVLNNDRLGCNAKDMALFECYAGDASFSRIRFQITAALAYGAQGLSNFCYAPHKMKQYKPDNPMVPSWYKMHRYAIDVLGRHLWGTRSMDVLHSSAGGRHDGAAGYDAGQVVVRATDDSLVGLLTPEARWLAKDTAIPEYLLFVDKRTGGSTPEARPAHVMLNESIPVVEFLDAESTLDAKVRKIVPGFNVRMSIEGGDARLLRVAPDLETLLGGKEGLDLYAQINHTMAGLQWKATPPAAKGQPTDQAGLTAKAVDAGQIKQAVDAARDKVARLEKILAAAVKGGAISQAQADDTLRRLQDAIDATAAEAKAANPK